MLVLVKCFSCTPDVTSTEVFLLPHTSFNEVFFSVTRLMLVLVKCFSYTLHTSLERGFPYTHILVLVRCFSCTPDASSEVFLLHTSC